MLKLVVYRLISFVPTLILVMAGTFILSKLTPGDPITGVLETEAPLEMDAAGRLAAYNNIGHQLGLDLPLFYFSALPYQQPREFFTWPILSQRMAEKLLALGAIPDSVSAMMSSYQVDANPMNDHTNLPRTESLLLSEVSTFLSTFDSNAASLFRKGHPQSSVSLTNFWPHWHWHGTKNQFHQWIQGAFTLQFGRSTQDQQPVNTKIKKAIRWTLCINLTALVLAYLIAVPLGVYSGWAPNSRLDQYSQFLLTIFFAIPVFWLATLLVVFFSTAEYGSWTNLFPAAGIWDSKPDDTFLQMLLRNAGQFIIPIVTLTTSMLAYITRQIRSNIAEQYHAPYILQARAKGLSEHTIMWKHAFKNASFPLITMLANLLPASIAGALVVEIICNVPGIGRLMFDAIYAQDWPVVIAVVTISAWLTMIGLLLADLGYRLVDPRIKQSAI